MSHIDPELLRIIGTDDNTVLDFLSNIKKSSGDVNDFKERIDKLDVILTPEDAKTAYLLLPVEKDSKEFDPRSEVSCLLKQSLGIDDYVVVDFILNKAKECKRSDKFAENLDELGCGINKELAEQIFSILGTSPGESTKAKSLQHMTVGESTAHGLTLPNKKIKWEELSDTKDLLPSDNLKQQLLDPAPVMGKTYEGTVKNVASFGCFVQICGTEEKNCTGLVHISALSDTRVRNPNDIVQVGQKVFVKVVKLQMNGKVSLSMKNINQLTGEEEGSGANNTPIGIRGRSSKAQEVVTERRPLTSPERWEIRQLIASGAASVEEYPELNHKSSDETNSYTDGQKEEGKDNSLMEDLEVELNLDDEPKFLRGQLDNGPKKYEPPKIVRVPKGSMNRVAMNGSNLMKEHRENKMLRKKEIEQQIRKKQAMGELGDNPEDRKVDLSDLRQQLVITAWERNRMREPIAFGRKTSMPISSQRKSLPVYQMKDALMKAVRENQFLIIVGQTGSGKTTQITQYLNDEGFSDGGIIGCTQPRRVAAVSVSKRVAEEIGCKLGDEVGYTIRFEDMTSAKTRIKYMTDGMLQREALLDPTMSKYSVIMLDEAHERTVATDVLFALLKQAAKKRPDLKVIVTSATLDSAKFSEYFCGCPVINIPGKTFPVEVLYSQTPQMDYIESALDTVVEIHVNEGPGDILVFLTGQDEIDSCCEVLYQRVKTLGDSIGELLILPVYSALPSEIQSKIFEPTPEGSRKVVFATNIAETSITINGIYYVIDPGFAKVNTFNPRVGMEQLVVSPISQAQANQRKGRAGRTGPGKCYRLYTESAFYNEMLPNTIPEIQRQNLSLTILMLKAMGINDLIHFEFMDPPPKNLLMKALEELFNLQALDDDGLLTKLGMRMSQFPMEPTLARALLASVTNNCSEDIIIVISMLSVQNVFYRPKGKEQEADNKKARFHHPYGDHLTLLNVYKRWQQANCTEQFCTLNFLQSRHLKRARDVRNQLMAIFSRFKLPIVSCHGDPSIIRETLVSGFFFNAAKRDSQVGYKTLTGGTAVGIHPSSSLYGKEYEYVMYHSLVLTSREYMSQVTAIDPKWLIKAAPHFYKITDEESQSRKKAKIVPLHNRYSKDQNSWKLSSIRQSREKALGIKR